MKYAEQIISEYDKKRESAIAECERVRAAAYDALPRLKQIDELKKAVAYSLGELLINAEDREAVRRDAVERLDSLSREEAEVLVSGGFSPGALTPKFECPICGDTGFTDEAKTHMCACLKQRLTEAEHESSNINSFETFETMRFDIYPAQRQAKISARAKELCADYAEGFPDNTVRNILLMGETGLGKSFLLNAIAYRVRARGHSVVKLTANSLVNGYMDSIRDRTAAPDYMAMELLAIDDLGAEPMISNVTRELIFNIINERHLHSKPVLIATNLTPELILDAYGDRIFSRLTSKRDFMLMRLEGADVRLSPL